MRMRAACLAGALLIATCAPVSAQPATIDLGSWEHFGVWLDAIDGHVAGSHDEAVRAMAGLRARELESVFPYMVFALRDAFGLMDRRFAAGELFGRYGTRGHAPQDLASLRERARRILRGGMDRFLKRAAMLHADIGVLVPGAHRSAHAGVGHLAQDGLGLGDEGRTWHWMLGRAFLDLVWDRANDGDVRLWYQAVGSHLLEIHDFTEAQPHVARGLELFPRDAELQFQRGFLHEAQAWPGIQAAVERQIASLPPAQRARYRPGVRSAGAEQADALAAFTKAVQLDPDHHEARIRLGRALIQAGDAERAAAELATALERTDHPTQTYLAQLFLGRAEEQRGRIAEARAAYREAARLFPDAQSPHFALSQLEMQAGRRDAAGALFEFLGESPDGEDPWWRYFRERVPGREAWLQRLREQFGREGM